MPLSPLFQQEIRLVAGAESVTVGAVEDASGYDPEEWSYSGSGDVYTILAGSSKAAQNGASALMDALGFIFFKPGGDNHTYRPPSIARNLSAAKQKFWVNSIRFYRAYAGNWGQGYGTDGAAWSDAEERWQTLAAMGPDSSAPVGHRWDGIIESTAVGAGMSMSNAAWFAANPKYVDNTGGNPTFRLDGSLTAEEYEILLNVVAGSLLRDPATINEFTRTHFDAEDGNLFSSAIVFGFAKNVVDKCRAGTIAAGNHPARAGISDLSLGIYAYAGHRKPPPPGDYSGLYTQVAVGFNKAGYATYVDLVKAHANRYDFLGIRDYTCVQLWCSGNPMTSAIERSGLLDAYDEYKSVGANGCNSENQWYPAFNLVGMLAIQRKLKTGVSDWGGAMDDVVAHVFNDDPAARDLFELFADPLQSWHIWNLKKVIDIVEAMQDGWYKDAYRHCIVVWYELFTVPAQMTPGSPGWQTVSDPFYVHFKKMMKHIWAMRNMHMLDCYPLVRQFANGALDPEYPELRYANGWLNYDAKTVSFTVGTCLRGATSGKTGVIRQVIDNGTTGTIIMSTAQAFVDNEPLYATVSATNATVVPGAATSNGIVYYTDWWMNPALPTTEEYGAVVAAVTSSTAREDDFDSTDLIVMHNIEPKAFTSNGGGFETQGAATVVFVGPGVVTETGDVPVYDDNGEPTGETTPVNNPIPLGSGLHRISNTAGTITYTHAGGLLFLDYFPEVRRDTSPGGDIYVYFPTRVNGEASIIARSRVRLMNAAGTYDITPTGGSAANLGPGQLTVVNGQTSGVASFANVNRYVSLIGSKALLPRVMAEEDFSAIGKILKAA